MSQDLPQSRIRKILKLDPEYSGTSAGAVQLITKATELFIQDFTSKASIETRRQQRKKIGYDDFSAVVKNNPSLAFLSDVVPKRQKLRELVEKKKVQLKEDIVTEEKKVEEPLVQKTPVKRQGILAFTSGVKTNDAKPLLIDEPVQPETREDTVDEMEVDDTLNKAESIAADENGSSQREIIDIEKEKDQEVVEIDDSDDNDDDDVMIDS